jgi:hypothetical protein
VITCNEATKYVREGGGQASFEDLKVGQSVRAYVAAGNVALYVSIPKAGSTPPSPTPAPSPQPAARVAGILAHIAGRVLTITEAGKDTVITCNDATKYGRDGGGQAGFEDLKVGQSVRAYVTADNVALNVFIAKSASPPAPPEPIQPAPSPQPTGRVAGVLTHVAGKALTIITVSETAATATVITCNDATKFYREADGKRSAVSFDALQVGQPLRAYYSTGMIAGVVIIVQVTAAQ